MNQAELLALAAAAKKRRDADPNTNPGVSPDAPPDMIYNPQTGQYTSREMMANHMRQQGVSNAESAIIGGGQGVTLGGSDEMLGAMTAVTPGVGGDMAQRYTYGRERARAMADASQAENPMAHTSGEIVGAVGTGLTYGVPAMAQKSLGGAVKAGAMIGAGEGAAYGLLSGEGGADRAKQAAAYGVLGAGVGAASAPIVAGLRQAYLGGKDLVSGGARAVSGRGSQERANRLLSRTVARSGRSVDDVDAALRQAKAEGQPEFNMADALGMSGQRRLSGIVRGGGDASQETAEALQNRQAGQVNRVGAFVADAFDAQHSAKANKDALAAARGNMADRAYSAARADAGPVDVRGALRVIDDRIGPMQGSGVTGDGIDAKLMRFRNRLAAKNPAKSQVGEMGASVGGEDTTKTAVELSDFNRVMGVKQDLGDVIEEAKRAGRNNEARELGKLMREIDSALEGASDGYRSANDGFRYASRVIDAVDEGADMARPQSRAQDNVGRFQRMNPDEQAFARTGYGNKLLSQMEAKRGETTNHTLPFTSDKVKIEATQIANDPNLLARRIGREKTMHDTMSVATTGSRTANNMEDVADLQPYDTNMIVNLLSGNWKTAAAQAGQRGLDVAAGVDPSTREMIAKALLSNNVDALRSAASQAQTTQERQAVMAAIARVLGNTQGTPAVLDGLAR